MKTKFPFFISPFLIIFLLMGITFSLPPDFTIPRTCGDTWGVSCDGGGSGSFDDAFFNQTGGDCPGAENNAAVQQHNVKDASVNASAVLFGGFLEASCSFMAGDFGGDEDQLHMWYYNGSEWTELGQWTTNEPPNTVSEYNRSVVFQVNNIEGEHRIRCAFCNLNTVTDFCADQIGEGCFGTYDNDDVNFTVTEKLKYDSWSLNISDYSNLTRDNAVKASVKWNKDLDKAFIKHNGTGSFQDYTVPITGNWTNYTLNLSNDAEFSKYGLINVSYIWANDTFGLDNSTYPSKYFYLWRLLRLEQMTVNDTTVYNNTAVQISCRVTDYHSNFPIPNYNVSFFEDDSLITIKNTTLTGWANLTYPATSSYFPQNVTYKCNITADPSIFYNISSQYANETDVTVLEVGTITECSVLDQPGTYRLTQDILNSDALTCMNITAQNVVLDCQGNTIDGIGSGDGVYSNQFNTTVKNCVISEWDDGIVYQNPAKNGTIQNMTFDKNNNGIRLISSTYNTLSDITVNGNHGIYLLSSSDDNTLSDITVYNYSQDVYGIYISGSDSNTLINITAKSDISNARGIGLSSSFFNNITNSSIYGNTVDYYLTNAGSTNYFRNTNFTDTRSVFFYGENWFNYNNESFNGIWLKSLAPDNSKISRKLINWNQSLMQWNDSSTNSRTLTYNITGLKANKVYQIFNNSVITYTYETDSSGDLPSFEIYIISGQQYEIKAQQGGFSRVDEITLNKDITYNGSSVQAFCRVVDANVSQPIGNYTVSFYKDEIFLDSSSTNPSGYANVTFTDTTQNPPQYIDIKCNITDDPRDYTASEFNSMNTTLEVIDLGIQAYAIPSSITYGNSVEIMANITGNASAITNVQANVSYTNTSGGQYETKDLTLKQSFSPTDHEYNLTYTPPQSSNYSVKVTVNASRIKWDTTSFEVWGYSELHNMSLNKSIIYNATGVQINCFVKDFDTNAAIPDYNVSFFRDDAFIGNDTTDANGLASLDYFVTIDTTSKDLVLKCNITDQPGLLYNASSENSKNETLQVFELGVQAFTIPSSITYGNSVEIIANITGNASAITNVQANISYNNITEGKIVQSSEIKTLTFNQSFSQTEHQYNLTYNPSRSGEYTVNITVQAEREKSNTTSFDVSFGSPIITFVFPNYRVMVNQTFKFAANISSTGGDLLYTDLTIGMTNESVMNATEMYSLPNLCNISANSSISVDWLMKSYEVGLTGVTLNVTPQNGSFSSGFSSHKIMYPIIETNPPINVSNKETITVKVIGNVSEISSINLSVFVPYTNNIINGSAWYVGNQTETVCTGETLSSERFTLHEQHGGNATCTGTNCKNAIDDNPDSYMSVGQDDNFDLIIELKSEEMIERIILLWQNASLGTSTIYYNSSGNWVTIPQLSDLSSPITKTNTTLIGFTPFKTNALKMNNTLNFVWVYEFEAYGTIGKEGLCHIYEYNFSSTTRSGTYNFNTTTKTKDDTVTQPYSFSVNYGYPEIKIQGPDTMLKTLNDNYTVSVTAHYGDLRNLSVNLTIYNNSVLQNVTPTEPLLKSIPEVLDENTGEVEFDLIALEDGKTNISSWVNSTTGKGYYNQSEMFAIEVTSDPLDLPNVTDFWFQYNGYTDKTNLYTGLTIYANVSDDVGIKTVKANVTYPSPDSISMNVTMSFHSKSGNLELWTYTFSQGSNLPLNMTGNYTIRIIALDIGNQEKLSGIDKGCPENKTFYVNDTYTLVFSDDSILMRGESIQIQAWDVTNTLVQDVYWNVTVTKYNETQPPNYNTTTTYSHVVQNNDPELNYSIFANASKNGNSGVGSWEFNVSKNYTILLDYITPSLTPPAGSAMGVRFRLRDARGGDPTGSKPGYITCLNESRIQHTFYDLYLFTNDYTQTIYDCYPPNSPDTPFSITINVSDQNNNTGEETFDLKTAAENVSDGARDGRGPSAAPGPTCIPEADYETNCTDEKDNDCDGATDCSDADCFDFPACIEKIPDFKFNVTPLEIEILQGEDGALLGSMENLGNIQLLLKSSVEDKDNCCIVDINRSFILPQKTTQGFSATIHVNTSTSPGEYTLKFRFSYYALQNSQEVKVIVKDNPVIFYILSTTPTELTRLLSELGEYIELGIDVEHLNLRINEIQAKIEKAKKAATEDNLDLLKTYNDGIKSDMEFIQAEKDRLTFQKLIYENKWNITYGIVIGLVTAYLIIQVIVPFVRLSRDVIKLTFERKTLTDSRVSAEKQYFLRKIDEQTFRRIVTEKHSQILKLTSTIKLKRQQRVDLLKKRLNPLSFGEYVKSKLSKKTPK
jgi:hypothetical protein